MNHFFIIGAGRSGTTMLQLALNRHSQIVIPPETAFFTLLPPFAAQAKRFIGGASRRIWGSKRVGISHDPMVTLESRAPISDRSQSVVSPSATGGSSRVRKTHNAFCRHGKRLSRAIGQGTRLALRREVAEHQRRLAQILRTFPEAKFILIYRDGRDVAASLRKLPWMPDDLYVNFALWLHYYRIQRRLTERWPERALCIRYEDLVSDPPRRLAEALRFIGLDYESQVAEGSGNSEGFCAREYAAQGKSAWTDPPGSCRRLAKGVDAA